MTDPYISVIVTAYNRRQYLPEALHSVEQQVLDRSKFEVIVVKNFEDPTSDNIIRRNGWKDIVINSKSDSISMTLLGVAESKGDVVAFLDDDDMYAPEKLSFVYTAFKRLRNLVWLHNLHYNMDESGSLIPSSDPRANRGLLDQPHFEIILSSDDRAWLKVIARYRSFDFNASSIAVSREVAEGIKGLRGNSVDTALTVMAGLHDGLMYHTVRRLTYYRLRSKNPLETARAAYAYLTTYVDLISRCRSVTGSKIYRRPICLINYAHIDCGSFINVPVITGKLTLSAYAIAFYGLLEPLVALKLAYRPFMTCAPEQLREILGKLSRSS